MKSYINKLKCLFLVSCLFILNNSYALTNLNKDLKQVLIDIQQKYNISAVSLSIGLPNLTYVDLTSGTLSKTNPTAINPSNLFQVASITKTFTAAIILKLEEEGRLDIHDSIEKWLPEYPTWKSIKIQQLLNHTSGIRDYISSENWWDRLYSDPAKIWDPKELLAISEKLPPYFSPGTGWHYSNANYVLAGLIIEKLTGHSVAEEMQRLLINSSLDLKNSYYLPENYPEPMLEKVVHGYYSDYDRTLQNTSWLHAAGAIISTPHDIMLWGEALYHGNILKGKQFSEAFTLVSTETAKPPKSADEPLTGLSMFRTNTPYGFMYFTPGLSAGYCPILVYLPCSDIVIAYSINKGKNVGFPFHADLLGRIMQVLLRDNKVKELINKYRASSSYPEYCRENRPSASFNFPKF